MYSVNAKIIEKYFHKEANPVLQELLQANPGISENLAQKVVVDAINNKVVEGIELELDETQETP